MTEFDQVFDGDLAEHVFLIASVIFVAFYACGILLMQWTKTGSSRRLLHAKTAATALFTAVAVSAVTGVFGGFVTPSNGAAKNPATISINELQKSVDMKSLPEQEVGSLF